MNSDGLKGLDILAVASFLLGYENLIENRQQSAQNDVSAATDRQTSLLLKEIYQKFEEQKDILLQILEAVHARD